jgi:hypothetical protein
MKKDNLIEEDIKMKEDMISMEREVDKISITIIRGKVGDSSIIKIDKISKVLDNR